MRTDQTGWLSFLRGSGGLAVLTHFLWLLLLLGSVLTYGADFSQQEPYISWEKTAKKAEQLLFDKNTTNGQFEAIRQQLAEQRDQAYKIANYKDVEVRTLEAQLDALGPPPAEGESEAEVTAKRRANLEQSLAIASGPSFYSEGAYERANLLISEIDSRIRKNTTQEWLNKSPSPLVPSHWETAVTEWHTFTDKVSQEFQVYLSDEERKHKLLAALPLSIALIVLAVLLIAIIQPRIIEKSEIAIRKIRKKSLAFLVSLMAACLHLLFPILSFLAIYTAFLVSGLRLTSVNTVIAAMPFMALFLVISYWLGFLIFRPRTPDQRIISITDSVARRGLRTCVLLGLFICLISLIDALQLDYTFSPASTAVFTLPVIVFGSLLMWRLALILSKAVEQDQSTEGEHTDTVSSGVLKALIVLMKASSILSVLFVSIGYDNLARQAIIPMVVSIGLIAFAMVVYYGILGLMARFGDQDDDQSDVPSDSQHGLIPFFLIALITLIVAPLLAMTWGARLTDIAEIWRLLSEGIELGDARISLNVILTLFTVLFVGVVATRWLQYVLRHSVLPKTKTDAGARTALITGVGYVGYTLSALIAVSAAGLNLSSLAVVAGALSVGIGFGLQTVVSNFVSGIILLIERPIKEGDWIEVSGYSGFVKKIAVRSTRIETFDLHDVVIPNSDLIAGIVKNMTLRSSHGRLVVKIGVAYGSDLKVVKSVLIDAAKQHDMVLSYPAAPVVIFSEMGDSALLFELRCFIRDIRQVFVVKSDLLFEIYQQLTDHGVSIPFPQRDIHIKNLSDLVPPQTSREHKDNEKTGDVEDGENTSGKKTDGEKTGNNKTDPIKTAATKPERKADNANPQDTDAGHATGNAASDNESDAP